MGFANISPWSLILILLIVVLLFGTKRMRHLGSDLGEALKGFKKGMGEAPTNIERVIEDDELQERSAEKVADKDQKPKHDAKDHTKG